ncbi:MAG: DUF190 domain-containing protein [Rhodocyclaceae bacterium]|nr:DUF190 domain-containing protein [Rhodocyclaceae bacterium]
MSRGYQITFFTQQSRRHQGRPLGDWLIHLAQEMDLPGATLIAGGEGFGRDRRLHAAHFFELADQPVEVVMVLTEPQCDALCARLEKEGVRLFYVKVPVEFGVIGAAAEKA